MNILGSASSQVDSTNNLPTNFNETVVSYEQTIEQINNSLEYAALETTLLYLLEGLETWGSWLDLTNNTGLLPEAEGRFMMSSTPILQTGIVPGGIGVVGFAQPIIISRNGIPDGFNEDEHLDKPFLIDYNDHIEDVFEQVSYLDRLHYKYGVELTGRTVQVYRKPIKTELTLATMLQQMGTPPDVAAIWIEEYAAIASLPQTIQLSWLIAGNPLVEDYQSHIENVLTIFDLDEFSRDFSMPQAPSANWVNQDPFWEEIQKQPFFNAFTNLLSNVSEEIQRSFIVALFFLEPTPLEIKVVGNSNDQTNNNENARLRPKPFFWSDDAKTTSTESNVLSPTIDSIIDPDQSLVAEALKQRTNLIKYWLPEQGYQIIPWSQRSQLNPNKQRNYFIVAVTALTQFTPRKAASHHQTNYATIVSNIVNKHLPHNQPVFKVFLGSEVKDRQVVDNQGLPVYFAGSTFLWRAEELENDIIVRQAVKNHKTSITPYTVVRIENGLYMAGSSSQLKQFFAGRQDYTVETVVIRDGGTSYYKRRQPKTKNLSISEGFQGTWLSDTNKVAQDIFSWQLPKQDKLFIQSTGRSVQFERSHDSDAKIKISSMVTWKTLPTNEELMEQRQQWNTNLFLVQVNEGYFLIPIGELTYLKTHADERPQVHSLLINFATKQRIQMEVQEVLKSKNLDCESVRVLSSGGMELAYSPQCSIVVTNSGWALAKAKEEVLLTIAQESQQPIAIFRPNNKPASAVFLNFLIDAEQNSLENLQVNTLVPEYNLEDLDAEEQEYSISISITEAIRRTLQFFPKQKEFEVLMPEGQRVKYTSIPPDNFIAQYNYDTINVVIPTEDQPTTFYRLKENG